MKTLHSSYWFARFASFAFIGNFAALSAVELLPRSSPEAQGVSSEALVEFVETFDREIQGIHSVMLIRHGQVIAEGWWAPYRPEYNHVLYSLSKSFTSTAVGMAVAEGKLDVDDAVTAFFPDNLPSEPSDNLRAMKVRDLLTMSAGHEDEVSSAADQVSVKSFLSHPVPHEPGTHFKYNTPATFMLSAIVQKQTGQTVLDYLWPRLFEPLGIDKPVWDASWQGISLGGYGLRVRTEDIAKFGQLYLQQGEWRGERLLEEDWVDMATSRQVSNGDNPGSDWSQGYGFQFWRCRHGAYRGDGAFGQYCIVMPEQDAVLAVTSGVGNMQEPLNIVWKKLLPAFQDQPLEPIPEAAEKLKSTLAGLELDKPNGAMSSPVVSEYLRRRYQFPKNERQIESMALVNKSDNGDGLALSIRQEGKQTVWPIGFGEWKAARGPIGPFPDEPLMIAGAWESDRVCLIKVVGVETPYALNCVLRFVDDRAVFESELNVAFGERKQPTLVGFLEQ